ncbi:hypothetical protein P7D22_22335 [Lichenihabitans sp. Uapishka_5]|uniref:hypothetical protein n=1 Tax=Lichenihabitans sp. Uapishka_5 TaxID=3037302 RepID=UPI0029E811D0|nr:hypothetical protein [Lichenihabitans sp. Uapishka_5]MDX7953897.1 hypothetical protein [Lichenihabitans sp. Uapishka_5]
MDTQDSAAQFAEATFSKVCILVNVKSASLGILKGISIVVLWLVSSMLTVVGALALIYNVERLEHPTDPSVMGALAWMLFFGAPIWIVLGAFGGSIITVLTLALWAKRTAQPAT